MSNDPQNPFSVSPGANVPPTPPVKSGNLSVVDILLCVFCSGIGCIIGIIRLARGEPSGGKMLGLSLAFVVIWNIVRFALMAVQQAQGIQ